MFQKIDAQEWLQAQVDELGLDAVLNIIEAGQMFSRYAFKAMVAQNLVDIRGLSEEEVKAVFFAQVGYMHGYADFSGASEPSEEASLAFAYYLDNSCQALRAADTSFEAGDYAAANASYKTWAEGQLNGILHILCARKGGMSGRERKLLLERTNCFMKMDSFEEMFGCEAFPERARDVLNHVNQSRTKFAHGKPIPLRDISEVEELIDWDKFLCEEFRQYFMPLLRGWENENLYQGQLDVLERVGQIKVVTVEKGCDCAEL